MALLVGCGSAAQAEDLRGAVINPPRPIPDFTLTSSDGAAFRLGDQRGKVVLLYFGYMTCPDVCPTTMADLQRAYQALTPAEQARVVVAFVSVDPQRDTPERLQLYTAAFHADFIGLYSQDDLQPVLDAFGVQVTRRAVDSALGYLIDHTASVFLIAPDGKLSVQFLYGTPYADMLHDVQALIARP